MEQNSYEQDASSSHSGQGGSFLEALSPSMKVVEGVVGELARSRVPVLLIGERGTGKRTIAQRIHATSGGLPEHFQIKRSSALTPEGLGTVVSSSSTVYLDEICDLTSGAQESLLEWLTKWNDNESGSADVRLICGSSHDVEPHVRAGNFREDLYYRLSGVCLRIPPLRQRKEDLSPLMDFFLARYSAVFLRPVPPLSAQTWDLFFDYSWPGNLRELEAAARAIVAVGDEAVAMGGLRSMLIRSEHKLNGERTSLKEASRAASREAEKELILRVLTRTRWNRRRAAEELQISYKALLYKLKQIGCGEYGAT